MKIDKNRCTLLEPTLAALAALTPATLNAPRSAVPGGITNTESAFFGMFAKLKGRENELEKTNGLSK